jgi:hypothetical protein
MILLQIENKRGRIIKDANWQVRRMDGVYIGNIVSIPKQFKDEALYKWLKRGVAGCTAEKIVEGIFSVTFNTVVKDVSHVFNPSERDMDSIYTVTPENSDIDDVVEYLFSPENASLQFKRLLQKYRT